MTVLAAIRRKRYSTSRLSVIVFAWLSVLFAPCSMAFMPDGQSGGTAAVIGVHEHCHDDKLTNPVLGLDYCLDHTAVIKTDSPKPFKHITLVALSVGHVLVDLALLNEDQEPGPNHLFHIDWPPVYLATLRIRI